MNKFTVRRNFINDAERQESERHISALDYRLRSLALLECDDIEGAQVMATLAQSVALESVAVQIAEFDQTYRNLK